MELEYEAAERDGRQTFRRWFPVQRGHPFKSRYEPSCDRVGADLAGDLDRHATYREPRNHIQGQQRPVGMAFFAERVGIGCRQIHRTHAFFVERWRLDMDGAEL